MTLIKAKIKQAIEILDELDIDLWLIFVRETDMMSDPVVPLVVGHKVVWQSAFFYARDGRTLAEARIQQRAARARELRDAVDRDVDRTGDPADELRRDWRRD